jgi:AraC-like DNA-binding protein
MELLADFPCSLPRAYQQAPQSKPIDYMHMHPTIEVGYCSAGTGILVVEDRVMSFQSGDVSVVNNTEMHISRDANDSQSCWTYFWFDPPALLASLPEGLQIADQAPFAGPGFPNIISPAVQPDICQLVPRMLDELSGQASGYRAVTRGYAAALMALLHRMCKDRPAPAEPTARTSVQRVAPALLHITNCYAEEIGAAELASLCHLSEPQFRRIFMSAIGMSPMQYLAQLRVRMAAGLLREHAGNQITDVAFAVGFESINTFNRQFRRTIGLSPREWRQHGKTPPPNAASIPAAAAPGRRSPAP